MKHCIRCGKQSIDDYMYCDNCGEFLATYEQYYYIVQYYQQKQAVQNGQPIAQHIRPNVIPQRQIAQHYTYPQTAQRNQSESRRKRFWKRIGYIMIVAVVVTIILTILETVGCIDGNWGITNETESDSDYIKTQETAPEQVQDVVTEQPQETEEIPVNEILNILDTTKVNPTFSPTIGQMVVEVFHSFEINYEKIPGTESQYHVTISGEFYPNPDIPYLIMEGEIMYRVTVSTGRCVLIADPNDVEAAFLTHMFN